MTPELEDLLQQCTVKITAPDHIGWGTGFFVAPGLILTCAHVAKNLNSGEKLKIQWKEITEFSEAQIVQLISQADLALLSFSPPPKFNLPCVLLGTAFKPGDKLYFFGYPDKDFDCGRPTNGICEGKIEEDEILLIKFGKTRVSHGTSGSALFNFNTGEICGIVKFTDDNFFEFGGGAISTKTILKNFPQLQEAQNEFHSKDKRWRNQLEIIQSPQVPTLNSSSTKKINDERLEQYVLTAIQSKPNSKITNLEGMSVSLKALYVPLKIREELSYDTSSSNSLSQGNQNIHEWTIELLTSGIDKVILIQGESGQGKTAFCEMVADELSKKSDLDFIPVLIRLQDIKEIKEDLAETLQPCLKYYEYFVNNPGWLISSRQKFFILLDGFDELIFTIEEIERFVDQILDFQENTHNQFLVTSRYFLPQVLNDFFGGSENLVLGKIQLMDRPLQEIWIRKWSSAISTGEIGEEFKAFLYGSKDDDGSPILPSCPNDITEKLAGEPLSIYLLASLFQIGEINQNDFLADGGYDGRVKIYNHVLDHTLKKVVKSKKRNKSKKGGNPVTSDFLELILMKAAAQYTQADGQPVSIFEISEEIKDVKTKVSDLYSLLASFYVRLKKLGNKDVIEFTHRSFGEFLFAKYIKTLLSFNAGQPNSTKACLENIYQALGSGLLTNEVLRFFVALSKKDNHLNSDSENFSIFFNQLFDYYWIWCEGSYVEFPRRVTKALEKYDTPTENVTETRHHHIYVGLNLILLTLELYRYLKTDFRFSQISFHFCEKPNDYQSKDEEKLLRIIGLTYSLKGVEQVKFARQNFVGAIGDFLYGIDLSGINLQGVDLSNANFCRSILKGADLSNTNLSGAYFMFSDLSGADLSGCNLEGARIEGANLCDATLIRANLGNLDLNKTSLSLEKFLVNASESDRKRLGINLEDINLDSTTLKEDSDNLENLNGINLDSANLLNLDLEGISLRKANLSNLILDNANCKNADLRRVNLQNSSLQNANLQNADLRNADLRNANFRHANLKGANLSNALTINAIFKEANLQQAIFSVEEEEVIEEETNFLDFWWKWYLKIQNEETSKVDRLSLWFISLVYIEVTKIIVESDNYFDDTDFSRANLQEADFEGVNLSRVDFEGANLRYANLKNTILEGALLSGADLSEANLKDAYFGIADLRGVKLRGAQLEGTVLKGLNYNLLAASTFLSHSTTDRSLVELVAQQLGRRGVLSWLNKNELGLDSFEGSLREAIQLQVTISIFLSEAALETDWCKSELRQVIEADEGRKHLLPIYLDDPLKLVNAHDFLQAKFVSPSDGFINEPSFLDENTSATPNAEAIADKIAETVYRRSIPDDWSEIVIVLDQRGHGLRRGSPVLPVNFQSVDIPTLTFRPNSGLRQPHEMLSGSDWENMVETMTRALSIALDAVHGHTRKVRVLGQAQTGLMWAVGRYFDRTTSAELYGYDRNGFEISNKGQPRHTPLTGGNVDSAKPVLDTLSTFSTSQAQVALGVGSPRYIQPVQQAVPDLPLFWIESGYIANSEQAMQLIVDVVASVERFRDEYGARELVLFWTTANHVALLAAANLTTHVIPKINFMEWDHAEGQYIHLPMPGD